MKSVLSTPDAGKPQPVQESFALSPAEFDNVDRIEFTSVLTTAGFGCFWAWMLAMLVLSPVTLDNGLSAGLMGLAARLAVVAVMALVAVTVYVGGRLRPEFNSQITLVKVLIALTPLPFFAALLLNRYLLAVPDFVIVATAAVAGVSCGLLLLSWGVTWATVDRSKPFNRSTAKSIAASFLLAGLLLVFIWMAPANLSVIVAIALYAASAITQHICSIRMPHTRSSNPGADEDADKGSEAGAPAPAGASHPATDAPVKLYHLSRYMPLFISAVAGGQLSWLSLTQPEELLVPMMAGGFAVGSLVVLGYIAIRGHIPLLNTLERLLVPLIALVCMIIAFTGWPLAQLAAALLCAAIAAYYILHWNIQLIVSYKHHPNAVSLFSQAMIAPLEGLAFGLAVPLAFTLFGLSPLQWQLPGAMILLFGCALVPSITRYRSNKAMESLALSEAHGLEMLDTVISLDQMEGFTMLAAGGAQAGGNGAGQRSPGSWRSRSLAVCKQHGLSPREAEVFLLLAKGRNAEHIASDLYISIYTAKTHGYRIYRKLGINSQQELIDMVERCELP